LFRLFLKRLQHPVLLLVLLVERLELEVVGLGRDQLFLEHFMYQFAHFVVSAGNELLFQRYHVQQVHLVETGGGAGLFAGADYGVLVLH
jgi:hypothetical protein